MDFLEATTTAAASAAATSATPESPDRGYQLFWVQLVFMILATVFVALRVLVKLQIKVFDASDYVMIVALFIYLPYGSIAIEGIIDGGTGRHVNDMTLEQGVIALRAWYLCEVIYPPLTALVRTSIVLFLLRIASRPIHLWILYTDIAVVWAVSLVYCFIMVFQCDPPSYFWEQLEGKPGHCVDENIVPDWTIAHGCVSALSDWIVGLLPIWLLWDVQLNRRTKATVAFLLSLGMMAGVALMVRIPFIRRLPVSQDFLYETVDVAIWSVMEPSIGIIAGCAATLRPLFKRFGFGWITRRSKRSTGYHTHSSGADGSDGSKAAGSKPGPTGRRSRRASGHPTGGAREESPGDSEIELYTAEARKAGGPWDVEMGDPAPEAPGAAAGSGVRVWHSVEVTSTPIPEGQALDQRLRQAHNRGLSYLME